ncbi:SusC/RagA family TonB-linked outer membrane protein [Sphingobacterium bambusae]|uniref:TonB-dependent receptor n=1 Tax=Sphingobacterium bambusae TaxID=662858 RepID=A0ABW6BBG9_9SPHI|nr:TonB-dependent receptor [Sphingobacterium bambusae]WPL49212.1 TonB-dependent receptor [Sphingobacterium bambusae]
MRKLFTLFLCLTAILSSGYAQVKTVTGTVKDSGSLFVLPGVTVSASSGQNTQTDAAGRFTIEASASDSLTFRFIGYAAQSARVGSQTNLDVFLISNDQALDEVVVIGYGTARKRDLTGSITSIKGDEIADKPNSNPLASLQGKVAGMQIVNSGRPGAEPDIRIRGTNSINGAKPLYVIDGILNDNMNFVNPADIESMEILKDPSSLAIFGVRGANGVIVVTTKSAKAGQINFNFNTSVGFKSVQDRMNLTDASTFKSLYSEQLANEGNPAYNYDNWGANTDWQDEIFQNGMVNFNNLSVSAANEKNKFYLGLGYMLDEGVVKNEKLDKISLSLNDQLNITDNFRVGVNLTGYRSNIPRDNGFYDPIIASAVRAAPIAPAYNMEYGLYNTLPDFQRAQIRNPLVSVMDLSDNAIQQEYRTTGSLYGEIDFLKNFTFKANILYDYGFNKGRTYSPLINVYNPEIEGDDKTDRLTQITAVDQYQNTYAKVQTDWLLTYKNTFGNHNLTATAGWTSYYRGYEFATSNGTQGTGDPIPDDPRFWYVNMTAQPTRRGTGGAEEFTTLSFLGRAIYNYKEKYLLNASFRRDGTSAFQRFGRGWNNFATIGAGWVVTNEEFMKSQTAINNLKIKGSWGQLGIQNTGSDLYPLYPVLESDNSAVFGDNIIPAYAPQYIVDRNLSWEKVNAWEAGFEMSTFNNKLSIEAVYYSKNTHDIIVQRPGLLGSKPGLTNAGQIKNAGIEFSTTWRQPINENLSYTISGNLTTIKNNVVSLVDEGYELTDGISRTTLGNPIGYFYGYVSDGIYQTNEDIRISPTNTLNEVFPGDIKYRDINGDGKIDQNDRTLIGNPTPDFTYGISLGLNYKGLDFSADFMGVYGNEIFRDWNRGAFAQFNYQTERLGRWNGVGTSNWEPILHSGRANNRLVSDYWIEDGSFFRLRNVQVGYRFNTEMLNQIKIKSLRVYLNAQNLFTATNSTGYTPEIGGSATSFGVDKGTYPLPAVYTFGVNLNF